ncbi:MAG: hypothetical protein LBD23_12975 [Oscillospiraceae bacterium]|nr:hypothetical protein [Oscillospiraceae bacterium]
MNSNGDDVRLNITSIILATGLAVIAFTEWDVVYKIFFGIPSFYAFLYILSLAFNMRFSDNKNDIIFPIPLFFFSSKTQRFLYNSSIDIYVISLISILVILLHKNFLQKKQEYCNDKNNAYIENIETQ